MADRIKLYVVPSSHPCVAVEAALKLKGLDYERIDLLFGASNVFQLARFGARTVPGVTIGSQRVVGSRLIMRTLDGLAPAPPLVPSDPAALAAVDAADEWGERVLQDHTRWIVLHAMKASPGAFPSFVEGYDVPAIPGWVVRRMGIGIDVEGRLLGHTRDKVFGEYLPSLPATLDKVDSLIADGVIGGDAPNVADLQISSSVRLLLNLADFAPHIDARPAGELARRLFPDFPGAIPAGSIDSPFV